MLGEPSAHDPVRPRRPRRMHFDVPHFGRDFGFGDDEPDRQYRRQYTYALAAHSRYIPSDFISQASSTVVGTFQAGTTTANALVITNNSTSTFTGGIQTSALHETGASTSTFANGINLIAGGGGCFAINNVCVGGSGGSGTVTSVALSAPSIFSVSGSPVTTSGTLTFAYNGTALPIANGGTDQTSFSGTNALINFDGTHSRRRQRATSSHRRFSRHRMPRRPISLPSMTAPCSWVPSLRCASESRARCYDHMGQHDHRAVQLRSPAPFTGVIKTETCYTDAGTVEMELTDGSTHVSGLHPRPPRRIQSRLQSPPTTRCRGLQATLPLPRHG